MGKSFTRDITRDIWKLEAKISPFPALLPLAVAHGPEEVPPWDWTRGYDPWRYEPRVLQDPVLAEHMQGKRPYGPEVEEAFLRLVVHPFRSVYGAVPEGVGGKPTPPLTYPRLVRAHAGPWAYRPDFPLYRHVWRLGKKALHGPLSPAFREAVVQTAQMVGLLDPRGHTDSLVGWHAFTLEVNEYLQRLREVREYPGEDGLLDYLRGYARIRREALGFRWEAEWEGYTYLGPAEEDYGAHAAFSALNVLLRAAEEGGGKGAILRRVGMYLMEQAFPTIAGAVRWKGQEEAHALVSSRAWVMLEVSRLYLGAHGVHLCPNPHCGVPFVPVRSDQRTCGSERCRKWAARNLGAFRSRSK